MSNNSGIKAQWPGAHGSVLGAFNATAGTVAATMIADLADINPGFAFVAGGVGAMVTTVTAMRAELPLSSVAYRIACWAGAGSWATWALFDSPWSWSKLAALSIGGMAAGLYSSQRSRKERKDASAKLRLTLGLPRYQIAAEWEERLTRVTKIKNVRIVGVEMWDSGAGFTLDLQLPEGGVTWEDLAPYKKGLASDAALPNACGVEFMPGVNRRAALMGVNTKDVLAENRPLPSDYGKLSILNPQEAGWHRDGTIAAADMREESWLIVGRKGSGKTTLMNRLIANIARCTDSLAWVIDLNNGALGVPWAEAWWEGRVPDGGRPAVDWIAHNGKSALIMTEIALAIARDRKATSRKRKRDANVTLTPVDAEFPALQIFCDEVAEIIGERTKYPRVRDNICELQRISRDAGLNIHFAALRGTSDVVDTGVKAGCSVRIAMKVNSDAEIGNSIGWSSGIKPQDIPYKGSGIMANDDGDGESARPFKAADMLPSQVDECAIETALLRPVLDERAQKVAAAVKVCDETNWYERRWLNAHVMFDGEDDTDDELELAPVGASGDDNGEMFQEKPQGTVEEALRKAREAGRKLRRERAEAEGQDPELADQFHEVMRNAEMVDLSNPSSWPDARVMTDREVPEVLAQILQAFGEDERAFISTADLAAGIGYDEQMGDKDKATKRLGQELARLDIPRIRERRPEYPTGTPTRGFMMTQIRETAEDFRRGRRTI